jgi:gamma-glutamyltranspeptidase/glutathione hydrolase
VTPFQAYLFRVIQATFTATESCHRIFRSAEDASALVGTGEWLRQPELADTLETLAREGEDLFYRGEIAAAIAEDMVSGGQISMDDLTSYRVERRAPLSVDYRGVRIHTNPPPSSGGLLIAFGLKLLEGIEAKDRPPGSARHVETLARVMDATAEARMEAAGDGGEFDPEHMLGADFVSRYRAEIVGRARARRGTTHISVIDGRGNVASLTVSNGEGSGYVVPGTGIVMNNMLGEEDLNPGGFQRWPTAHRMTSMMAPTALRWPDGAEVTMGSGGSNRIRSAILQVLVNLIDHRLPVKEAVEAPRVHYENDLLSIEADESLEDLARVLRAFPRHQLWDERNMFFGGAHTVASSRSGMRGAGDPRRGGVSMVSTG